MRPIRDTAQIIAIAAEAAAWLVISRVLVSTLGFHRTSDLFARWVAGGSSASELTIRRCSAWVTRLAPLVKATCLHRSLAIRSMIGRRGVEAEIEMGVRRSGGVVEGHAWVWDGTHVHGDAADVRGKYELMDWVSSN